MKHSLKINYLLQSQFIQYRFHANWNIQQHNNRTVELHKRQPQQKEGKKRQNFIQKIEILAGWRIYESTYYYKIEFKNIIFNRLIDFNLNNNCLESWNRAYSVSNWRWTCCASHMNRIEHRAISDFLQPPFSSAGCDGPPSDRKPYDLHTEDYIKIMFDWYGTYFTSYRELCTQYKLQRNNDIICLANNFNFI